MANGHYHFDVGVSNSSTQSAVAMASYRSGEKLYSLKDGETKSYRKRFVEPESFILKPDNAPKWTLERETLWNEVEEFEDRSNARLSRNVLVALPNELTHEQQREIVEEYIQNNFVDKGMVADTSIHRDDENNPHAHIMLTVRSFDENGDWEKRKSKRVPKLDEEGNQIYNSKGWRETRSVKINDWDDNKTLLQWRKNWAEHLNEKSREFESEKMYSHETFEQQGKREKAQIRLTREEYQFEEKLKKDSEKKGKKYEPSTYYAKKNEEIKQYNQSLSNVIHLEDYKTKEDYNELFNRIRKDHPYDANKIESTRKMVDRAKGYVDYSIAKNLYNEFHSLTNKWKQKLERDGNKLNSKKDFYKYLFNNYNVNNHNIEKYGYSIDNFKQEMNEELKELNNEQTKFEEEKAKFQDLRKASETALEYQENLLNNEFNAVYSSENSLSYEEKYHAIQLMKDHQIKLPLEKIKDDFNSTTNRYKESNYVPAWKQAKDTLFTLRIYNRTLNKMERTSNENKTPQELKDDRIKIDTFNKLKEQYTTTLDKLEPLIDEELKGAFPSQINIDSLDNVNVETKSFILEKYNSLSETEKDNTNLYELTQEALQESESKLEGLQQQKGHVNNFEKEDFEAFSSKYNHITEGLISMFDEMFKGQFNDRMRKNKDKTKTYRRKGTDGREV